MSKNPDLIFVADAVAAGYCLPGVRLFAKRYGIDWSTFLNKGVPPEGLPNDAMCTKVVGKALTREERQATYDKLGLQTEGNHDGR